MSDKSDVTELKRKEFAKRTRWLVWVESLAILGLLVWISVDYENNIYLQSWAGKNIGPLGFLLNGTLAGLYAGTLLGWTLGKVRGREESRGKDAGIDQEKSLGPLE